MRKEAKAWDTLGSYNLMLARRPSRFIREHIAPLLTRITGPVNGSHREFSDERDFWDQSENLPFASVSLEGFRICDWFPRAPGVYWSHHGRAARDMVWGKGTNRHPELGSYFTPRAKLALIEDGGIGTIRLLPRVIEGTPCYLGTAISDDQCAGGIPLAIPVSLLNDGSIPWGSVVTLVGRVLTLSGVGLTDTASAVHHATPILIFVESIKGKSKKKNNLAPVIISPVVLFSAEGRPVDVHRNDEVGFAFAADDVLGTPGRFAYTFVNCEAGSKETLKAASAWIEKYVQLYFSRPITNYDELSPELADAPLSYQRLVSGNYERSIVVQHLKHNGPLFVKEADHISEGNVSINVTLGNGVIVKGDIIVANAIKDSFNRVRESNAGAPVKEALEQLATQLAQVTDRLAREDAQDASDALKNLVDEASREKPRKRNWQLGLDTIGDIVTQVGSIGQPVLDVVTKLVDLFPNSTF
jgi:hypothetical protein